jgi:predicted lipoprotein with Yx(FWY)xxD motif
MGMLALAACSSGGSSGSTPPPATGTAGSSTTTVTIGNASGQTGVLATAAGRTLYTSDQEDGTVICRSSACTAIWLPLTVGAGQSPVAPSQLTGKLSTVMRPDGTTQVALDGKPLYTFSFDRAAGQDNGDGQKDSFDGTNFTWHVARANSAGSAPSATAPSASSGGGGYGYP